MAALHEIRVKVANPVPRSAASNGAKKMAKKKKAKKKSAARKTVGNPRKRTAHKRPAARRVPRRAMASNAAPRKRRHHRRHRRNPSGPLMDAGLAALAGVGAFVAVHVANMVANKRLDQNIRRGIAIAGVGGGIFLAKDHPMIGAGVAAGSAVALAGTEVGTAIMAQIAKPQQMGALVDMGALEYDEPRQLGAGMGEVFPPAPWAARSPFSG